MSPGAERGVTALLFVLAVLLGTVGNAIATTTDSPERAVVLTGIVFAASGAVLSLGWFSVKGWNLTMDVASFGAFTVVLVLLVAAFFAAELRAILFRADTLIWAESPFVNDIIKFRTGNGPLYGAPSDLDSFWYTPGSPFLTWALASVVGMGESIPAYRVIQVLFVVAAVVLGVRSATLIRRLRGGARQALPWSIAWFLLLFLAATNTLTNPFNHLLHNDALGLLVCAACFLVIVEYAVRPRAMLLAAMVLLPAAGFLVKQSLAIWCALFGAWLLVFARPFRFWRAVLVGAGGLALVIALYAGGIGLWGEDFRYWIIEGLGKHTVSPLRSIEHAIAGWAFWVAGIWGGWVLLRGDRAPVLLGLWMVWATLFAIETYTSGIAWMMNHMGPGSFLGIVWLCAALPEVWPAAQRADGGRALGWLRAGFVTAIALFALSGFGAIRVPVASLPRDADRYATSIEREFDGRPPESVLLDHGSWPYLHDGIVQKDRSAAAGEAGFTGVASFGEFLKRVRMHHYDRILVRDLHSGDFMYDYASWEHSSGVRDSLLRYYREAKVIPGVEGVPDNPWLRAISVLEPRIATDSIVAVR
jgi:hypothetical protein